MSFRIFGSKSRRISGTKEVCERLFENLKNLSVFEFSTSTYNVPEGPSANPYGEARSAEFWCGCGCGWWMADFFLSLNLLIIIWSTFFLLSLVRTLVRDLGVQPVPFLTNSKVLFCCLKMTSRFAVYFRFFSFLYFVAFFCQKATSLIGRKKNIFTFWITNWNHGIFLILTFENDASIYHRKSLLLYFED